MCTRHAKQLGYGSPLQAGGQELLAEDEGVRRETEFEVSRRQNLGQTNRNCMQGVLETDKFLY